jgi:myo-inositol-1(or 4)-monophosphatase
MSLDYDRLLDTARRAALAAGKYALAHPMASSYEKWKGHRDILVGSALDVQQVIVDIIKADFPDHAILAEEGPDEEALPVEAEHLWIVDPIDGSLNFSQGLPFYSVSIGFREDGSYRLGVVYDPNRDELFDAVLGKGARLNGQSIRVDKLLEGYRALERALIATDWPTESEPRQKALQLSAMLCSHVTGLNVLGSPALGLCYVACGRLHGYFHVNMFLWDLAAGGVILREAGGTLTNLQGGSWLHSDGGYIASNSVIHGWMLNGVKSALEQEEQREVIQRAYDRLAARTSPGETLEHLAGQARTGEIPER